jgi:hypothetical protein
MNFDFESWKKQLTEYLTEQIKNNNISYESLKNVISKYNNLKLELQQILEYAYQNAKGREKDNIYKLYKDFSYQNASSMVNKLNKLGYALKEDNNYKDVVSALEEQAYRIIEKTRHAQRSEVQYMIFRIFIVNKKEIPHLLSKAFNPIYSDELFKTFIYSFLSGILGEGGEENE